MAETSTPTSTPLTTHGIRPKGEVHWNLDTDVLLDISIARNEGVLSAHGALVTETGERTGRSPNDKFIVEEESTSNDVNWGDVNISTDLATFERLRAQVIDYLSEQEHLFVQDLACGAEPSEALPIRVITHNAWHSTFARNMFVRPSVEESHNSQFTVFHAPHFEADACVSKLTMLCYRQLCSR